jgi:chromosome segregation ATPase
MDHKEKLEELNKAALEKLNEYAKKKESLSEEHQQQLHEAKHEWQTAWNKLMEVMLVLERLEI